MNSPFKKALSNDRTLSSKYDSSGELRNVDKTA